VKPPQPQWFFNCLALVDRRDPAQPLLGFTEVVEDAREVWEYVARSSYDSGRQPDHTDDQQHPRGKLHDTLAGVDALALGAAASLFHRWRPEVEIISGMPQ
jgi:hypothetical protein